MRKTAVETASAQKWGGSSEKTRRARELGNTVLSMSTRARELRKSALCSKKTTMRIRNVLASKISTESTNGRIKLSANHSGELLIDAREDIR